MGFKKSKKKKSSAESVATKKPTKTILKRKQMRKEKRQSKKTSKLDFYKKKFVSKRVHNDDEEVLSEDEDEVASKAKEAFLTKELFTPGQAVEWVCPQTPRSRIFSPIPRETCFPNDWWGHTAV